MDKPTYESFFAIKILTFGPYPVVTAIDANTPEADAYYAWLKTLEVEGDKS